MVTRFKVGDRVRVKTRELKEVENSGNVAGYAGEVIHVDGEDLHVRFDNPVNTEHGIQGGHGDGDRNWHISADDVELLGSFSKATTPNPKDLLGVKKVSLTKFPAAALIHGAHAMMNGAEKYGSYNWREKDVIASIYVDAAARHLLAWFEREETAEDSGVHHLGHALASIGIILDAQENGNLIDDRPSAKESEVVKRLLDRLKKTEEKK